MSGQKRSIAFLAVSADHGAAAENPVAQGDDKAAAARSKPCAGIK